MKYKKLKLFFNNNISWTLSILKEMNKDSLYLGDLSALLLYIFDTSEWKATGKSGEGRRWQVSQSVSHTEICN